MGVQGTCNLKLKAFTAEQAKIVDNQVMKVRDIICLTYKAAFPRAKFLCHISHALQSLLTDF